MEQKINIAELLKDCPKGMELDCVLYENLYFDYVREHPIYPIVCYTIDNKGEKISVSFTWYGKHIPVNTVKCVIFPKGKTTWEGFALPCQFKDGDIIFTHANCLKVGVGNTWISIFKERRNGGVATYVDYAEDGSDYYSDLDGDKALLCMENDILHQRFATEEEKEKLFQVIKDKGYHWNNKLKILEKLVEPEFKICNWVVFNNHPEKGSIYQIKNVHNYEYTLQHILGGSMAIPFSRVDMLKLWTIDDAKDGDVLVDKDNNIGIFQKFEGIYWYSYIYLGCDGELRGFSIGGSHKQTDVHPATKEQRDLLFQKIKEAGYCWNDKTKTLEKLIIPKFKGGDKIRSKNKKDECFYILRVDEDKHKYVLNIKGYCLEFKDQDHYELVSDTSIEPKFKVGDKVRHRNNHNVVFTITSIEEDSYVCGAKIAFWFDDQDKYELIPNKFDINTLKPFDKVLVRDHDRARWDITFYECYDKTNKSYPYRTLGGTVYKQCIPYEGNEHLIGLIKDCDDYYKTWINEENEFN